MSGGFPVMWPVTDRQEIVTHLVDVSIEAGVGVDVDVDAGSPRMRAAICLLFLEGMSFTVSSADRPFWSTMFTSTPGGRQARS